MESMQTYWDKRAVEVKVKASSLLDVLKALELNKEDVDVSFIAIVDDTKKTYKALNHKDIIDWDFLEITFEESEDEETENEVSADSEEDSVEENIKNEDSEIQEEKEDTPISAKLEQKIKELEKKAKEYEIPVPEPKNYYEKLKEALVEENDVDDGRFYFPDHSLISDTDGLIKVIEAVWNVAKLTPGIRFGTRLFEEKFRSAWNAITVNEHTKTDLNRSTTRAMMKLLVDVFYNSPVLENELSVAYYDTLKRMRENYNSLKSAETLNQVMNILYRHESN